MADTRYIVEIELRQLGDVGLDKTAKSAKSVDDHFKQLKAGWRDMAPLAGRVRDAINSAAGAMFTFAKWGAMIAGGAIFAGVTAGVINFNDELEKAKISLGAVFSAQGVAADMPDGIRIASEQIKTMRKDAALLPGEFADLLRIFRTGAIPALHSGINIEEWRKLSSQIMATAAVAALPMDQAAREAAMLIEGRSGAHNVFGMRLLGLSGDKAEAFNKLAPDVRMAKIRDELAKYQSSIEVFGRSYEGLSSTFLDNAKEFVRASTEPLFERVKETLGEVNGWLDENRAAISHWGTIIGLRLSDAFDSGRAMLAEWGPILAQFADNAWTRLSAIWQDLQPLVERFGEVVKEALKDPATIDKLITFGKIWAGVNIASFGLGLARDTGMFLSGIRAFGESSRVIAGSSRLFHGAASMIKGIGPALKGFQFGRHSGIVGRAAAMGEAGAAWGSAGAFGAGLATMSTTAFGATFTGLAALGVTAGSIAAAIGSWGVAIYQGIQLINELDAEEQKDRAAMSAMAKREIQRMQEMEYSYAEMYDEVITLSETFRNGGNDLAAAFLELELSAYQAAAALKSDFDSRLDDMADFVGSLVGAGSIKMLNDTLGPGWRDAKDPFGDLEKKRQAAKHPGGGGGTHVQKVEIVVTSNQNPSRIAREVFDVMASVGRNPRASRYTPNYSSLTR